MCVRDRMKDLFVPIKNQLTAMVEGGEYLVKIYLDELSNRLSATAVSYTHLPSTDRSAG